MDRDEYQRRFDEALLKAVEAHSATVRDAYFDLASFYHEKLGGHCYAASCRGNLAQCLAREARRD